MNVTHYLKVMLVLRDVLFLAKRSTKRSQDDGELSRLYCLTRANESFRRSML